MHEILNPFNVSSYEYEDYLQLAPALTTTGNHLLREEGRYKGVLRINATFFSCPGLYQFCYANPAPDFRRDYDDCTLFSLCKGQNLMDVRWRGKLPLIRTHPN